MRACIAGQFRPMEDSHMTTTTDLIAANAATGSITGAAAERTGKRANWVISHSVNADVGEIVFEVKGAGKLTMHMGRLSEAVKARAAIHGMVQRVSDAAAIARDTETGAAATPAEKYAAMKALVEHYESGTSEWARKGTGEGRAQSTGPSALLREVLAIAKPEKDAGTIAAFVKGLKPAQVQALLVSEQLKEAVVLAREAAAERAKAQAQGVNAEELLGTL